MKLKNLLIKEFALAAHPSMYLFLILDFMLLIPSYPYYVAFIYTCLAIFLVTLTGRENKDIFYTISLPIRKRDAVKARCLMISVIELAQIIVAVPIAFLGVHINPKGNMAGIESNVAFFGFVFIMYALFNGIFIPMFYKTAYKAGIAFAVSGTAVLLYDIVMEVAVQLITPLKVNLDTTRPDMMVKQIPILIAGIVIYGLAMVLTYKKAAGNFEKVDI